MKLCHSGLLLTEALSKLILFKLLSCFVALSVFAKRSVLLYFAELKNAKIYFVLGKCILETAKISFKLNSMCFVKMVKWKELTYSDELIKSRIAVAIIGSSSVESLIQMLGKSWMSKEV